MLNANRGNRWQESLLGAESSIEQAMLNLTRTGLRIALITSNDGRLLGTVADGDIRRAILAGAKLYSPALEIANKNCFYVSADMPREKVLDQLLSTGLMQAPIIDSNNRVTGIVFIEDKLFTNRAPNLFVIMAGGEGVRLRPHTLNTPKPLLKVGGETNHPADT
jgi:CBS-domain-containing membrane protein